MRAAALASGCRLSLHPKNRRTMLWADPVGDLSANCTRHEKTAVNFMAFVQLSIATQLLQRMSSDRILVNHS